MSHETELSNTMYDILHAMGKDAGFLYDTIDTYIKDALNTAVRKQRLPMKFDTLKTKNPDLHAKLSILISKNDKQDIK